MVHMFPVSTHRRTNETSTATQIRASFSDLLEPQQSHPNNSFRRLGNRKGT